jgi:hypothetical protein
MIKIDGAQSHIFCKVKILPQAADMIALWQQFLRPECEELTI